MYEIIVSCPKCGNLMYDNAKSFTFCPDCGNKLKKNGHCLECGFSGTLIEINEHKCRCNEHGLLFKRFDGLFGDFECPKCRKERLMEELKKVDKL